MSDTSLFEIQNTPAFALIRFRGFLDASTVQQARPALLESIPASCANFLLDLGEVDFLDSHGAGLFVSLLKRAHQNRGRIVISGAEGQPSSVLRMVGFNGALVAYCENIGAAKKLFTEEKVK